MTLTGCAGGEVFEARGDLRAAADPLAADREQLGEGVPAGRGHVQHLQRPLAPGDRSDLAAPQ